MNENCAVPESGRKESAIDFSCSSAECISPSAVKQTLDAVYGG